MRIMAVDYGDARTGIAVSDISATLVGETWVIHDKNQASVAKAIAEAAAGRDATLIVVGHPKNMDGSAGPRAARSEQLAEALRAMCNIEVVLWDERMTTVSAHRVLDETGRHGKKRKEIIDAVAASMILESYIAYLS
ncbi:MAG: Holliday junction resolvase RuvX [Oscillospiraceae bacterium]|nr:Holliday junction resolvase RuvX [Oscillospiraceae bacterium]